MRRIVAVTILCGLAACIPAPEDGLDYGTLCSTPSTECPSHVLVERQFAGRNQIDYAVRNVGAAAAAPRVAAAVGTADASAGIDAIPETELLAVDTPPPLEQGSSVGGRFTADALGVRENMVLLLDCDTCSVELDWVFASVPRECFEDEDCSAGWVCDGNAGRCAECLSNDDCDRNQICLAESGRCDPPETAAGCSTAAAPPVAPGLFLIVAFGASRRRRRRRAMAAVVGVTLLLSGAGPVFANAPTASLSLGAGSRFLAGDLAAQTGRGVSLTIGQEIRWKHVGAAVDLGTAYFLTAQDAPPFSRSLQTYGVSAGPRGYVPWGFFELSFGPSYRRVGLTNNSLVRLTGTRTSFHAVGAALAGRVRWSGLEVRVEGTGYQMFELGTLMVGIDLLVGLTGG